MGFGSCYNEEYMKRSIVVLGIILFLGFLIRLLALSQSLWLDEGVTARVVREYGFLEIIPKFSLFDFHPPLYYFFMKFWTSLFGFSEVSLRMPSILFSLITAYALYIIASKQGKEKYGLLASLFFLFNPLILYYSQEARMYMMAVMWVTLWFLAFQNNKEGSLLANLCAFFAISTFYGTTLFFIFLFFFQSKQIKRNSFMYGVIGALILHAPLLFFQLFNARVVVSLVPHWSTVLGTASFKNLYLIFIKFSSGRVSFEPKIIYLILSFIWGMFVWTVAVVGMKQSKHRMYGIAVIGTIVVACIFSFFTPLLQYFRFLFLIPFLSLLLVFGSERIKGARTVLVAGFVLWSFLYLFFPQFHREDWKSLSVLVPQSGSVVGIVSSLDALRYYVPQASIIEARNFNCHMLSQKKLTLVPYTFEVYGILPEQVEKQISLCGYRKEQEIQKRGVSGIIFSRLE